MPRPRHGSCCTPGIPLWVQLLLTATARLRPESLRPLSARRYSRCRRARHDSDACRSWRSSSNGGTVSETIGRRIGRREHQQHGVGGSFQTRAASRRRCSACAVVGALRRRGAKVRVDECSASARVRMVASEAACGLRGVGEPRASRAREIASRRRRRRAVSRSKRRMMQRTASSRPRLQ